MSVTHLNQAVATVAPRHCSFCFEAGHTVRSCRHIDVRYLYHEFMYFYGKYGEEFLCNNLTVLFQPHEAQALLYYLPIRAIRNVNTRNNRRMVVDLMMPRYISNHYLKLHKKIVSMANLHLTTLQRDYLPHMDVIGPVMNETVRRYESIETNGPIGQNDILVGYHNHFTYCRHARFRCYDYEIRYQMTVSIPLSEGLHDYPDYNPPSILSAHDNGRYGRARVITWNDILPNLEMGAVNVLASLRQERAGTANSETPPPPALGEEEPEPEWLEARPPRNVTIRPNRAIAHGERRHANPLEITTTDLYQVMFEDWVNYTRMFEETYKRAQPEVEIQILPQPPSTASVECPICMTELDSMESVSLGCCVYSFCGDCYSNQYLTKEHRAHQCMMCRAPFSQIQVYQESMAPKLKPKPVAFRPAAIPLQTPSQLTELDDDIELPTLSQGETVEFEFPPDDDVPMTLSELY